MSARARALASLQRPPAVSISSQLLGCSVGGVLRRSMLTNDGSNVPRALHLPVNIARWAHQQLRRGSSSQRLIDHFAGPVAALWGTSIEEQLWQLRYLRRRGLQPLSYYTLGLYRPERWAHRFDYAFSTEAQALLRQFDGEGSAASVRLLGDKVAFVERAKQADLSVPECVALLPRGASFDPTQVPGGGAVFFKRRSGSGGIGAFSYEVLSDGPRLATAADVVIAADDAVGWINRRLSRSEYVIEPRIEVARQVRSIFPSTCSPPVLRVVTVRMVRGGAGSVSVLCSFLTARFEATDGAFSHAFDVDLDALRIRGPVGDVLSFDDDVREEVAGIVERPLPALRSVETAVRRAHRLVPGIATVAWDLLLTSSGPVLLEGNTAWGVETPQLICGPFLVKGSPLLHAVNEV